jgi:hypothetical protein
MSEDKCNVTLLWIKFEIQVSNENQEITTHMKLWKDCAWVKAGGCG